MNFVITSSHLLFYLKLHLHAKALALYLFYQTYLYILWPQKKKKNLSIYIYSNQTIRVANVLQDQSMAYQKLWNVISLYLSAIATIFHYLKSSSSSLLKTNWASIFFRIPDTLIALYYRLCGLSPCTVDIDYQTTIHFWTATHRRFDKPSLVMVHGYGGNSLWQFVLQVRSLSRNFNLYVPDLMFFGKSYTNRSDRSESFQAKCVVEGLKRLGVDRFSVYGISYGGFVVYRMAEMCPETVEKVVIVSSGVVWNDLQKEELLRENSNALEILVAQTPHNLRLLVSRSIYKYDVFKWVPDYVLQKFIDVSFLFPYYCY